MGLANICVADDQLDAEVEKWCAEIMEKSPNALMIAKRSFNADSENIRGIGNQGMLSVKMYYDSEESKEGVIALGEKRKPDFRKFTKLTFSFWQYEKRPSAWPVNHGAPNNWIKTLVILGKFSK